MTGKEKLLSCEQWKVRMEIKQRLLLRGRDQTLEHSTGWTNTQFSTAPDYKEA